MSIELRSVNGRFLDLALRLPDELRSLEPALRELLGAAFKRGKIELRLSTSRDADSAWPEPTPEQLQPSWPARRHGAGLAGRGARRCR